MSSSKQTQQNNEKLCCGKFGKTVGLKGDIRLYLSSGQMDTLDEIESLYLEDGSLLTLEHRQYRADFIIVRFKDRQSVESVKTLTHQSAFLFREDLPELPQDQYYWFQLNNLRVLGQQKQDFGVVSEVYTNGVQDILKTSTGAQIPFVRPEIVKKICLDEGIIEVDYDFIDIDLD